MTSSVDRNLCCSAFLLDSYSFIYSSMSCVLPTSSHKVLRRWILKSQLIINFSYFIKDILKCVFFSLSYPLAVPLPIPLLPPLSIPLFCLAVKNTRWLYLHCHLVALPTSVPVALPTLPSTISANFDTVQKANNHLGIFLWK